VQSLMRRSHRRQETGPAQRDHPPAQPGAVRAVEPPGWHAPQAAGGGTCMCPMLQSSSPRWHVLCRSGPNGWTGTAIRTTRTSSCSQILTATVSASSTLATSTADRRHLGTTGEGASWSPHVGGSIPRSAPNSMKPRIVSGPRRSRIVYRRGLLPVDRGDGSAGRQRLECLLVRADSELAVRRWAREGPASWRSHRTGQSARVHRRALVVSRSDSAALRSRELLSETHRRCEAVRPVKPG
jgi:hypothetical protein